MSKTDQEVAIQLPVDFQTSVNDVVSRYATELVIQKTNDAYILCFFEIKQPIVIGTPEEQRAQLETLRSVKADCVARIIVSPERMDRFMETLNLHFAHQRDEETETADA